jgi:hypothetical protein
MANLPVLVTVAGMLVLAGNALADDENVRQERQTTHYRVVLQIGATEVMYTASEAKAKHPTSGEIMIGGRMVDGVTGMDQDAGMAAGMGMEPSKPAPAKTSPDLRHLELHVYSRATGKMVPEAHVTIAVIGADKKSRTVPIARMYGIDEGPDDLHYGNNFSLPTGSYVIDAAVNGERARFSVTVPQRS